MQNVNFYHSNLKKWIFGIFDGIATKYMSLYLYWRRALTEGKALTLDRQVNKITSAFRFRPLKVVSPTLVMKIAILILSIYTTSRVSANDGENFWFNDKCPICLSIITRDQIIVGFCCRHRFHCSCIITLIRNTLPCPICRSKIFLHFCCRNAIGVHTYCVDAEYFKK